MPIFKPLFLGIVFMKLDKEDLEHCHKVIRGDIQECLIFDDIAVKDGKKKKYEERIKENKRIMAKIEYILGYALEYKQEKEGVVSWVK